MRHLVYSVKPMPNVIAIAKYNSIFINNTYKHVITLKKTNIVLYTIKILSTNIN